jgi:hypothetical protein
MPTLTTVLTSLPAFEEIVLTGNFMGRAAIEQLIATLPTCRVVSDYAYIGAGAVPSAVNFLDV